MYCAASSQLAVGASTFSERALRGDLDHCALCWSAISVDFEASATNCARYVLMPKWNLNRETSLPTPFDAAKLEYFAANGYSPRRHRAC